jgi:protein AATF/BFR2
VSRKTLFDNEGNVQEADEEDAKSEDSEDEEPARPDSTSSVSSVKSSNVSDSDSEVEDEADYTDMRTEDFADADGDDPDIDSNEAFGSGEEELFKSKGFTFRGSKQGPAAEGIDEEGNSDEDGALMWDTEDEEEVESGEDVEIEDEASDDGEGEDMSGSESGSDSGSGSNTSSEPSKQSRKPITARDQLKNLLTNDAAAVASTLSASANADGEKGRAIKQQYLTFDRLLDARIKLQKGLTAANNISLETNPSPEISSAAQLAEEAALKLFSTIESIRHSLSEAATPSTNTSKKRKRPSPPTLSTPTPALWARLSAMESQSFPHRRTILNKWSTKTRSAQPSAPRSQLDRPTLKDTTTMTSMLDTSLTPSSLSTPTTESYDDTPFYQSLLRELIASRASLSQSQSITSLDIPPPSAAPKQHRKGVDTKASKGRKVRYTVHEKLQNFAAEEERGTWTEGARREFFASLFGGRGVLDENAEGDEVVGEESALRLFRS